MSEKNSVSGVLVGGYFVGRGGNKNEEQKSKIAACRSEGKGGEKKRKKIVGKLGSSGRFPANQTRLLWEGQKAKKVKTRGGVSNRAERERARPRQKKKGRTSCKGNIPNPRAPLSIAAMEGSMTTRERNTNRRLASVNSKGRKKKKRENFRELFRLGVRARQRRGRERGRVTATRRTIITVGRGRQDLRTPRKKITKLEQSLFGVLVKGGTRTLPLKSRTRIVQGCLHDAHRSFGNQRLGVRDTRIHTQKRNRAKKKTSLDVHVIGTHQKSRGKNCQKDSG